MPYFNKNLFFGIAAFLLLVSCVQNDFPKNDATPTDIRKIEIFQEVSSDTNVIDSIKRRWSQTLYLDHLKRLVRVETLGNVQTLSYDENGKIILIEHRDSTTKEISGKTEVFKLANGWKYVATDANGDIKNIRITDSLNRILRIKDITSWDSTFDSIIKIYSPQLYLDSIIYWRRGKKSHQRIERWFVSEGKPTHFFKAMDQFWFGEGRDKDYSIKVEVDSTGQPIYPKKGAKHFNPVDYNFYSHTPYYNGLDAGFDSDYYLIQRPTKTKWAVEHFFDGDVLYRRNVIKYQ